MKIQSLLPIFLLVLTACTPGTPLQNETASNSPSSNSGSNNTSGDNNNSGTGAGTGSGSSSKVVFSRDVAPIMVKNCTSCHRSKDAIGPFPLENYNDFYTHREAIKRAVVARTMPPPGVDNSGQCQSFDDAKWMTEEDIKTIVTWVENGAPEGNPGIVPPLPEASTELPGPKSIIKIPQPYTPTPPAGKLDDYRCFIVDPGITSDTKLTAIEVIPDKAKIVHHVIVFKPASVEAQASALQKNGADGRPGYSCFGAAGVPSTVVGLWGPGSLSRDLKDPETGGALGMRIEAGRKLIVQIHYNITNGVSADQTAIAIKTNANASPVKWTVLAHANLELQPGQKEVITSATQTNQAMLTIDHLYEMGVADSKLSGQAPTFDLAFFNATLSTPLARTMRVFAVGPHMHQLGRKMKIEMIDWKNQNTCMANIPLFDFEWQMGYFFKKPLTLDITSSVKITCNFDTSGRTKVVHFAEGTEDEMCLAFLLVTDQ